MVTVEFLYCNPGQSYGSMSEISGNANNCGPEMLHLTNFLCITLKIKVCWSLQTTFIFSLHYGYLGRINKSLASFSMHYNHHPMRSDHNLSPYPQFYERMMNDEHYLV